MEPDHDALIMELYKVLEKEKGEKKETEKKIEQLESQLNLLKQELQKQMTSISALEKKMVTLVESKEKKSSPQKEAFVVEKSPRSGSPLSNKPSLPSPLLLFSTSTLVAPPSLNPFASQPSPTEGGAPSTLASSTTPLPQPSNPLPLSPSSSSTTPPPQPPLKRTNTPFPSSPQKLTQAQIVTLPVPSLLQIKPLPLKKNKPLPAKQTKESKQLKESKEKERLEGEEIPPKRPPRKAVPRKEAPNASKQQTTDNSTRITPPNCLLPASYSTPSLHSLPPVLPSNPNNNFATTSNPTTSNPTISNPTTSNPTTSNPTTSNPTTLNPPTTNTTSTYLTMESGFRVVAVEMEMKDLTEDTRKSERTVLVKEVEIAKKEKKIAFFQKLKSKGKEKGKEGASKPFISPFTLEKLMENQQKILNSDFPIPLVFHQLTKKLFENGGASQEGIFRISIPNQTRNELLEQIKRDGVLEENLQELKDPHVFAALWKSVLRELPPFFEDYQVCLRAKTKQEFQNIFESLSKLKQDFFTYFAGFISILLNPSTVFYTRVK